MESMNSCCGLIISCSRIPVPLRGISVDVQVKGFVADVSARLKYKNVEEKAVEAVFVFPMDNDSAVYSFEATVEGKTIVAELQEKEQAHKTYDEAISQGQEAFLLEEDQSSRDVFTCSVGNLPPGQEAEVKLSFVQELPVEVDGAVRFVLPAVLNPRYTPKEHKESVTVNIPRLPADQIPYTLDLNAQFHSAYGISKIQSNCDISPLEFTDADKLSATVSLASGHKFERDVEFLVYYKEENKPSVTIEAGHPDSSQGTVMADSVAMLNFYPSFPDMKEKSNCGEFIFLIDRSGSMWDQMSAEPNAPRRIDSAKETLVLLLKSLPLNCYFNIYSFGSEFSSIFTESAQYTQGTMEAAVTLVNEMDANMGGTEILEPLKKINKTGGWPGHPRQLFVFSDGEVGNTREVIAEVRRNSHNHRCFTFGIGEGASTALLKGIARAASGTCEFITGKERMQSKVLQTLKCSLQPTVKEISLDWTLPPGVEATLLSGAPSAIFQGQRSIVYAKFMGKVDDGAEGEVCLKYKFKDEIFSNVLRLQLTPDKTERPMIHRLAAKVLISQLENSDDSGSDVVKKRILETSVQSGVISSLTAYVAVNKETKNPVQGPPMRRDIPLYGVPQMMMCCMPAPKMMSCSMGVVEMEDNICYDSMLDSADICTPDIAICKFPAPTPTPEMPPLPTPEELTPAAKMEKDFFKLISLQNADGSWNLNAEFASILESSEEELGNKICHLNVDSSLWVTVLAITWLHAFRAEQRDEWELLEEKALDWITSKKASSLSDCVQAANELLSSSVDGKVFGV